MQICSVSFHHGEKRLPPAFRTVADRQRYLGVWSNLESQWQGKECCWIAQGGSVTSLFHVGYQTGQFRYGPMFLPLLSRSNPSGCVVVLQDAAHIINVFMTQQLQGLPRALGSGTGEASTNHSQATA